MQLSAKSQLRETPSQVCTEFLDVLLKDYPRNDCQVRLWDGSLCHPSTPNLPSQPKPGCLGAPIPGALGTPGAEKQPRFTLVFNHPGALREMFLSPSELALGETYIHGDFDIEGDIDAAFDLADYLLGQERSLREKLRLREQLHKLPTIAHERARLRLVGAVHSKDRDRRAVCYHYDLPADFYALFLDRRMVYSCAYFATEDEDLDSAQVRKLDYICRKLRLHPGERLLDLGCGWGGMVMHAAAHYGVEAVGITLSARQAEVARKRLSEAGLKDCCRIEVLDYRDMNHREQYDKIVSIGMFEHVGEALLPEYFRRAWELLRPGGVFLNHGIAYSATYRRRGPSFSDHYVFPDGELVPISTSLRAAEFSGFEVRDVESLREHYALTLRHWTQRLQAHSEEARRITDATTYRIWRLYMAGARHAFQSGRLNIYQALLAKPVNGRSGLPLTRNDWYQVET